MRRDREANKVRQEPRARKVCKVCKVCKVSPVSVARPDCKAQRGYSVPADRKVPWGPQVRSDCREHRVHSVRWDRKV